MLVNYIGLFKVGLLTYVVGVFVSVGLEYAIAGHVSFYEAHRYLAFTVSTAFELASIALMIIGFNEVGGVKGTLSFIGCLLLLEGFIVGFILGLEGYVSYIYGVNTPIDLLIIPAPSINIYNVELLIMASTVFGVLGWLMLMPIAYMVTRNTPGRIGLILYALSVIAPYAYSLGLSHMVNVYVNYATILYILLTSAALSMAGALMALIKRP